MNNEEIDSKTSRQVLDGLKWTAFVRILAQMTNWVMSIIVIRYIKPEDFGLKSMAEITLALLFMLNSGGMEKAIVYTKDLSKDTISKAFGFVIIVNTALFFIQFLGAYPLAEYYAEPRVRLIAQALAMGFLLAPFNTIPTALLSREMDFKLLSTVSLLTNIAGGGVVLFMAVKGYGVWALIAGPLFTSLLSAITLNIYKPCLQMPSFSLRDVKGMVGYGGTMVVASFLWMVYSRVDVFIAGRFMSVHEVGLYAVALHLASLPIDKIMPVLHQVAFPAYSRLRDDKETIARYFIKSVRLTSLVLLPLSFGLAGVTEYVVPAILGKEWVDSRTVLVLLCLVFPVRAIVSLCATVVSATGHPRINLQYSLLATVIMTPAFLYSVQYGSLGMGLVWLLVFPWAMLVNVLASIRIIKVSFFSYLGALMPPLLMSSIMLAGLLCFASTGIIIRNQWATIAAMVLGGGAVYVGGMFVFSKWRLVELLNMRK